MHIFLPHPIQDIARPFFLSRFYFALRSPGKEKKVGLLVVVNVHSGPKLIVLALATFCTFATGYIKENYISELTVFNINLKSFKVIIESALRKSCQPGVSDNTFTFVVFCRWLLLFLLLYRCFVVVFLVVLFLFYRFVFVTIVSCFGFFIVVLLLLFLLIVQPNKYVFVFRISVLHSTCFSGFSYRSYPL